MPNNLSQPPSYSAYAEYNQRMRDELTQEMDRQMLESMRAAVRPRTVAVQSRATSDELTGIPPQGIRRGNIDMFVSSTPTQRSANGWSNHLSTDTYESAFERYNQADVTASNRSAFSGRLDIKLDPDSFSDEQKKTLKHHGWVSPEEFESFKEKYGIR